MIMIMIDVIDLHRSIIKSSTEWIKTSNLSTNNRMSSESSWIDFTAGWISGGVSTLAIQPIDTILTRLQANASISNSTVAATTTSSSASASALGGDTVATLRPTSIFRGMISNFGVGSLWRGSSAMIGAVPVQNAVLMTGYGFGKRWAGFDDDNEQHNDNANNNNTNVLMGVFIGGTVGGILQSFVMSPIEQIKVSQQVNIGKSVSAATTSVISGSLAWRGLGATLLRDGIPHGVWFVSYEYAKVEFTKMRSSSSRGYFLEGDDNGPTHTTKDEIVIPMLSGAFAAFTAWGVGYPFDLIKTRIQAGKSTGGIIATAREIVKESSLDRRGGACYGLYRGFGLKLLRSIPASAIGFLTYETVAKALSSRG